MERVEKNGRRDIPSARQHPVLAAGPRTGLPLSPSLSILSAMKHHNMLPFRAALVAMALFTADVAAQGPSGLTQQYCSSENTGAESQTGACDAMLGLS